MIQFLSLKVNNFLKLFCIILLVYSKFLFIFTFYDNFYHADLCLHMSPQTLSVSPRVFCRVTPSTLRVSPSKTRGLKILRLRLRMTLGKNCAFGTILQSIAKCSACCLFCALSHGQTKTALRWRFCHNSKEKIRWIS